MTEEQELRVEAARIWLGFIGEINKAMGSQGPWIPEQSDLEERIDSLAYYLTTGSSR